jgi:hypothetical protein
MAVLLRRRILTAKGIAVNAEDLPNHVFGQMSQFEQGHGIRYLSKNDEYLRLYVGLGFLDRRPYNKKRST